MIPISSPFQSRSQPCKLIGLLLGLFSCFSLMTGCSSNSTPDTSSYYMLSSPTAPGFKSAAASDFDSSAVASQKRQVALKLTMPEYLDSPYLVMQLDNHTMHYAVFHMWAEPLHDSVAKALLQDLNQDSNTMRFMPATLTSDSGTASTEHAKLSVNIEYFHVTRNSTVILAGEYQLQGITERFFLENKLQQDGYSHAVAQMRDLVDQLAQMIVSSAR